MEIRFFDTDTIEGYAEWVAALNDRDLQQEIDDRSFDSEQTDTGQWGAYDTRYRAALAEQNKRADADPFYFNSDRD